MPPKAKFTKQQIVNAALNIIRESGTSELTARALGKRLGSSACPVFTVFDGMEEVMSETVKAAKALYASYVKEGLKAAPAFKGVGMQYVNFAIREPKLFSCSLWQSRRTDLPATTFSPPSTTIIPSFCNRLGTVIQ